MDRRPAVRRAGSATPRRRAERAVRDETVRAAAFAQAGPGEALGILTHTIADSIEGGRIALIRPERRRRILHAASLLGVRAFDANLLIAIVQDDARRGVHTTPDDPRLRLLDPASRRSDAGGWARAAIAQAVAAIVIAAGAVATVIVWLTRG